MLMLLTLLLSTRTSLDVGAADVNAILASAAAGSENIYGTGQCAAPRVTGAAARDCHGQPCHLVTPCFVRSTTASGEAQSYQAAPVPSLLPAADRDTLSLIGLGAAKTLVYALHYVFVCEDSAGNLHPVTDGYAPPRGNSIDSWPGRAQTGCSRRREDDKEKRMLRMLLLPQGWAAALHGALDFGGVLATAAAGPKLLLQPLTPAEFEAFEGRIAVVRRATSGAAQALVGVAAKSVQKVFVQPGRPVRSNLRSELELLHLEGPAARQVSLAGLEPHLLALLNVEVVANAGHGRNTPGGQPPETPARPEPPRTTEEAAAAARDALGAMPAGARTELLRELLPQERGSEDTPQRCRAPRESENECWDDGAEEEEEEEDEAGFERFRRVEYTTTTVQAAPVRAQPRHDADVLDTVQAGAVSHGP